ncbi:MAG: DUF1616 domain-containing protein [Candidatus Moraniibacteriota bacterium]
MEIILELLKLNFALIFLLFLPGYFALKALFPKNNFFSPAGEITVSFGFSIVISNFLMMFIDRMGLKISASNVFLAFLVFTGLTALIYFKRKERKKSVKNREINFSKGWMAFFSILILSIYARLIYLTPKIIPHTTDSGHHMYWVQHILDFARLPDYGIPDVIIGEHIIFAAIASLSGLGIVNALPAIVLFLINIFSLFAIFLLAYQLSKFWFSQKNSFTIGLLAMFAIGVLYAISSPQAKYINGGVVGNMMGGLFIPLSLYLFAKALERKNQALSALGVLFIGNLAYTHHLSTFVYLYVIAGLFLAFGLFFLILITRGGKIKDFWSKLNIIINLKSFLTGIFLILFVFIIRVPSYLNPSAIDTAVGSPSKSTRTGMELSDLILSTGPWRFFYSVLASLFLFGIIFLTINKKTAINKFANKFFYLKIKDNVLAGISACVALAWFWMIFAMSSFPDLLKIDIPSGRIANYLTYPSALLSVIGIFFLIKPVVKRLPQVAFIFFFLIISTGIISGSADISEFYPENSKKESEMYAETFKASQYLKEKTTEEEVILKDHVYLPADSWVKVFLMRGYERPLSRALLKRYDDPVKDRETCTRDMIAIPDTETGKNCFEETSTKYIILRNGYDTQQFEKSENFSKLYASENVVIYQKN